MLSSLFCWHWFLPPSSPCPVSSDLYKSLQSGSQVALPPHLQLAFSGKTCPPPPSSPALSFLASAVVCMGLSGSLICWWQHVSVELIPSLPCCVQLFFLQRFKLVPLSSVQMSVRAREETTRGRLYDPAGRPYQGTTCKPVGALTLQDWNGFNQ